MALNRLSLLAATAALALAAQVGAARATSFTWDTTVAAGIDGSGTIGPYTSGGQTIYAVGYEIIGGATATAKLSDTLMPATGNVTVGTGIGVTDTGETGTGVTGAVGNTATTGGQQITDMVVFALPGNGYYPTSFTLRQICANGTDPGASTCAAIGSSGFDNVSIFVGGTLNNLPTGATSLSQLVSSYGFTQLTAANLASGSSLTGSGDRTVTLAGNIPGAYLIIAASLNDSSTTPDSFKVASLTANRVPEPGTVAILGVGLVGLAVLRRRRQSPSAAA